ncbi:MAG: hypothetical protein AAFZ65_03580 [Planctomycetota bacterium]
MAPTADRILTLHPEGKQGVRIERSKYNAVCGALRELVPTTETGIALKDLRERMPAALERRKFPAEASVGWYLIAVKQDLEARGELEVVPGARPQHLRRVEGAGR